MIVAALVVDVRLAVDECGGSFHRISLVVVLVVSHWLRVGFHLEL